MKHIEAIEKWNEFCKNNPLAPFPKPGSEQANLKRAYLEAIIFFDSLPEENGVLTDPETGNKYRYEYDGKYEHYRKEEK